MFQFDGPNKRIYIQTGTTTFDALDLYSEWKRWFVQTEENSRYDSSMRSIGGDAISATKYIAGYIELLNGWRIKPYGGDYVLTIVGNLFATGGETPFIGADSGTVLISMETTGNALALQTNEENVTDVIAPTWESAVGIIDAYQSGDQINVRWGHATDASNEVHYNVYISDINNSLWSFKLGTFDGNMININTEFDGITDLKETTYYIGIRAVDKFGNETSNTNIATVNYHSTIISDTNVNIVSVNGVSVDNIDDFKADVSNIDMSTIPQKVWSYVTRELTVAAGLTPDQETKLNDILLNTEDIETKVDDLPSLDDIRGEFINTNFGELEILNNQMMVYDKNGVLLVTYNLYDNHGNPTMNAVYRREIV